MTPSSITSRVVSSRVIVPSSYHLRTIFVPLRGSRRDAASSRTAPSSSGARRRHRATAVAAAAGAGDGGFVRYGVKEEVGDDGGFMETYGLNLGGGNVGRETLTFAPNTKAVALVVTRPLGIVFEEVDGKIVAVELVEGSNAERAGVKVGDVLRMTSAVALGKSRVEVKKWQVEPSTDMRKQGSNRRAFFVADGAGFEAVMNAIISNGQPVDGEEAATVSLLLERRATVM